jgi:CelD/BcsL family acetyltransferase involved in cellulose biosynthesis
MSCEAVAARVDLPLRVGTRTVGRVRRRLVRMGVPLDEALAGRVPALPVLPVGGDGYYVRGLPAAALDVVGRAAGMRCFVRANYPRHYADLSLGYDQYLATFSAKSRSSLKRKRRKLEERSGGRLDLRLYRTREEMETFYRAARSVSALTYQERLLDAGLPEGALPEMLDLAAQDQVRAWLLFVDGRPVSYLYAPAERATLRYAYLGYDPAFSGFSPGTVLQIEAMRMLMEENRFRWFDFTEGDGQHKRQFATASINSLDLLLLRPTLGNLAAARALAAFDGAVAAAKRLGLKRIARTLRR